jgi:hypothetical protein
MAIRSGGICVGAYADTDPGQERWPIGGDLGPMAAWRCSGLAEDKVGMEMLANWLLA